MQIYSDIWENINSMKHLVILITLLVTNASWAWAQISITSQDMPSNGDTARYSTTTALGLNLSQTGANQNWNFSNLRATGQGLDEFRSFIRTPYLFYSQFFGAIGLKTNDTLDFGVLSITNVHTFYRARSGSYTAEGTGFTTSGIPLASDYSNSDRLYSFPLTYNDSDSDNFRVATTLPTLGTFIQQGSRNNKVDGWGTITTPFVNNQACIRYSSDILETDSLITSFISFGFPLNRREIKWLAKGEPIPLLEVTGPLFGNTFTPTQVKYRDSFRNLSNNNSFLAFTELSADKVIGRANQDTFQFSTNVNIPLPVNYNWSFSPNTYNFVNGTSATEQNPRVVFGDTGKYSVTARASFGNQNSDSTISDYISISSPTGLTSLKEELFVARVSGGYISLSDMTSEVDIKIYNIAGILVLSEKVNDNTKLDITHLPKGKYIILATKNSSQTQKLGFVKY